MECQNPVLALGKRKETSLAIDRITARADLRFISDRNSTIGGHRWRIARTVYRMARGECRKGYGGRPRRPRAGRLRAGAPRAGRLRGLVATCSGR
jgi:hypothetical protein